MTTLSTLPKPNREKELAATEQGSDLQYIFDSIDSKILSELEGMRGKLLRVRDENRLSGPLLIAIPIVLVVLMF